MGLEDPSVARMVSASMFVPSDKTRSPSRARLRSLRVMVVVWGVGLGLGAQVAHPFLHLVETDVHVSGDCSHDHGDGSDNGSVRSADPCVGCMLASESTTWAAFEEPALRALRHGMPVFSEEFASLTRRVDSGIPIRGPPLPL